MNNAGAHAQLVSQSLILHSIRLRYANTMTNDRYRQVQHLILNFSSPPPPASGEVYVTGERGVSIHGSGWTALCLRPGGYIICIIIPTVFTSRVLSRVKEHRNANATVCLVYRNALPCVRVLDGHWSAKGLPARNGSLPVPRETDVSRETGRWRLLCWKCPRGELKLYAHSFCCII